MGEMHGPRRVRSRVVVCRKPGAETGARARRRLRSRSGLGRGVDCARDWGSGEALIALETGARARHGLRSRPGLGRAMDFVRDQGLDESLIASSELWVVFRSTRPLCWAERKWVFLCRFSPS
ncbi:hypothetical protein BDA96_05G208900 [Sorghum bicolor]|uniref:Uncharacterized protein n=2 Tax=Sorghum bicolor TaxID=4558 RepID=A0A921UI63_SORBI|nr:hypothetical protein BDA96_05G208900 [Sorghum bicolor]OQU83876.1 hypothetical protein SORBI_3005G192350 [Sorghum bicolor]